MNKIVLIVGSTRTGSFNQQLADVIRKIVGNRAEVGQLAYDDVPFMNQDIEWPTPDAVARARGELAAADGIWIVTPEYNGFMPALPKNLLDWMSRPMEQGSAVTAVGEKPVVMSGAGGRRAAAGALEECARICTSIHMDVVGPEPVGVAIGKGYGTGVLEVNDEDRERLAAQAEALLAAMDEERRA